MRDQFMNKSAWNLSLLYEEQEKAITILAKGIHE